MSEQRKKQQWVVLAMVGGAVLLIIIVLGQVMNGRSTRLQPVGANRIDEQIISDRTSQASPELTWARQSRQDIEALNKSVSELTKAVTTLKDQNTAELTALREQYDEAILAQQAEINGLKGGARAQPAPPGAALGRMARITGRSSSAAAVARLSPAAPASPPREQGRGRR
ncbi:hypothetical protein [Cereibacter changlensis]|uniref:hypothetical protein n=1 Tax=Cereibacter changlensis TaxID=402884 RepID=UPI00200AB1FA|nr:hypothetical protein [Cereibacter changlensis]